MNPLIMLAVQQALAYFYGRFASRNPEIEKVLTLIREFSSAILEAKDRQVSGDLVYLLTIDELERKMAAGEPLPEPYASLYPRLKAVVDGL